MASDDSTPPAKCLKCEASLASPIVCSGCHALYPIPKAADYFELLGLQREYRIDEARLTAAFRAITRNIHPDRFSGQPAEVRALATRLSAEINEGYRVLKDPVRRAGYLLELAGGPSATEIREVPGDVLAEVMMLRENAEEARTSDDVAALGQLSATVAARRGEKLKEIGHRADQLGTATPEEKAEFRKLLNSVRYFDALLSELTADPLAAGSNSAHE